MKKLTMKTMTRVLNERFGGLLSFGPHLEGGEGCINEVGSAAKGLPWTDSPAILRCWDFRSINDMNVSREVRAKYLPKVFVAYDGSMDWPLERQLAVSRKLVILTIQRLIAEIPGLSEAAREQCRQANTLEQAARAVRAAEVVVTAWEVVKTTKEAVRMAREASRAVTGKAVAVKTAKLAVKTAKLAAVAAGSMAAVAATEEIFIQVCEIWLEAAK
jgi:hypothetical protein